jgi:prepilin-type N-terminal cleavage/methylation domain-containing protein
MKNSGGFTLIEFVVSFVIVSILALIAMPIYKGFVEKVRLSEAKTLTGSVLSSQRVYYAKFGSYYDIPSWTDLDNTLTIDSRANKYFLKVKSMASARYPGAIEAGAYAESLNLEVYQFWPASSASSLNLPRWIICKADTGEVITEEW